MRRMNQRLSMCFAMLLAAMPAEVCRGQMLMPAIGPGTSHYRIEQGTAPNTGPSAAVLFNPVHSLVSPGAGYPTLGVPSVSNFIAGELIANVPVTLETPSAGPIPGIIRASASITGVGTGVRAGIIAFPPPVLEVGVVPGGEIAFNAFGAYADYVLQAPPYPIPYPLNVVSFLSGTFHLSGTPGDFAAASVRAFVEIGSGVGPAFALRWRTSLPDIVARFDGVGGPLSDDVAAGWPPLLDFPNANTMTFSAVSQGVIWVWAGETVRFVAVQTIIGDPMSYTANPRLDPTLADNLPNQFVGFGSSGDAQGLFGRVVPVASRVGMVALGVLVVLMGLWALRRPGTI